MAAKRILSKHTQSDTDFLLAHGWEFKVERRYQYGWRRYWDHPTFFKWSGLWWLQSEALSKQKAVNKHKGKP